MTDTPSSTLTDLHGAVALYASIQALAGIASRATDLLWSELPELRPFIDLSFGYGLALVLVASQLALRFRPRRGVPWAFASLGLLASICGSQLLAGALSLPQYTVYEGDSLVTLLASVAVLIGLARHAITYS